MRAAALFPLMTPGRLEFGERVADLQEDGPLQPIVLHQGPDPRRLRPLARRSSCWDRGRFAEWRGVSPMARRSLAP